MSQDEHPDSTERLEDDPVDEMEREADEARVERAWEESDVDEGEAPTG